MPVIKKHEGKSPAVVDLLIGYQSRLRVVFLISAVGLWITGILLGKQSSAYDGFMDFSSVYGTLVSIKHLIIYVMIIAAVLRGFVLGRKIKTFQPRQKGIYAGLLLLNTILGFAVIVLSGISAALG